MSDYLPEQTEQGRLGRAMNLVGDEDGILKCNEMIENSLKDFQVLSGLLPNILSNTFTVVYVHLAPI